MIIVECDPDKFVVKKIVPRRQIEHGGGKTGVLERLEEVRRAVGIIDEDPHSRPPGEMERYVKKDARGTVKLLRRKDGKAKSLIQLSPNIEGWLIHRAKQNRISLKDYGLPDDPKKMHDIPHIEEDPNFKKFIKRLIQTSDDEVNTLRKWIRDAIG